MHIVLNRIFYLILLLCLSLPVNAQMASDSLMMKYFNQQEFPVTSNNRVQLLMSGREKFNDMFREIRKAEHFIHLEYFNFRNDSIASALFELLEEKAAEGVRVRAMFDDFGNWSNNKPLRERHLKKIRKTGIEIVRFDPIRFPYINHAIHRDHQKIVVIDGTVGYTGGMNIADYYIKGLPKLGPWHDMHMRIEGDAVRFLQGIFLTMWNKQTGQHIGGPEYFPETERVPDSCRVSVAIVNRAKERKPKAMSHAYAKAIESAEHHIQIVNPYFVPTPVIRKAIKKALKKGTEVEIMIPAKSDIPFTPKASFTAAHRLMKKGARIYLFNKGFHHSKIMMIDSVYCTVGSANLDSRSLRYDYEANAFIFDRGATLQLNTMFAEDKLNSTLMTKEMWKKRSAWNKFVGWFGNILTPFL